MEQTKIKRCVVLGILSFLGSCTVQWMFQLEGAKIEYTNSVWSVACFFVLVFVLDKALSTHFFNKKRDWILPIVVGFLMAFAMVVGTQLEVYESVPATNLFMWVAILIWGIIFTLLLRYFWESMARKKTEMKVKEESAEKKQSIKDFFLTWGIILGCYIPVFLAVYPGFFVYDAQTELLQVVTREFSTHHPLCHVLLLGGVIQAGYKMTGSYNIGIALYTIFQMAVMSGIFAWCVEVLKRRGVGKTGRVLITLYFGLCPVMVMFSLCSAKDGLFTGMLLLMLLGLQDWCKNAEVFWKSKKKILVLLLSTVVMMLLRHNGFYAFLVFGVLLLWCFRKQWKRVVTYVVLAVSICWGVNTGLTWVVKADDSENQEILTVPITQLARTYAYNGTEIPEEELEVLYTYLPKEALARYTPKVSDGVKISFVNEAYDEDKAGFWNLWAKWGARYPVTYMNAWFMTSYGFWYPDTVIDVYRGNTVFTYTYDDSSYFGYEVEEPGRRESKLPWLDEMYRKMSLEIAQQKIPVISMLFSPGFMFWTIIFLLGFLCYVKKWKRVIPFLLPGLCWMTVILGPTYLVRYVVFLWVLLPVLLWEVSQEIGCKQRETAGAAGIQV